MTQARYRVDVMWSYLFSHLNHYNESYGIDLDPDFQRAHVWAEAQQIAYVEYQLRGGISGKDIIIINYVYNEVSFDYINRVMAKL